PLAHTPCCGDGAPTRVGGPWTRPKGCVAAMGEVRATHGDEVAPSMMTDGPSVESLIKLFSYYRDAEIRGASLLMKMMQWEKDPEAQVLFSRHVDDETRHAWLWTKRIRQLGGMPVEVPDGYQRRL